MQIDRDWLLKEIANVRQQQHATLQGTLVNALSILGQAAGAEAALSAMLKRLEEPEPKTDGDAEGDG